MVEELTVGLGDRSYRIRIGEGILDQVGEALRETAFPRRVAVVTNPTVRSLYAGRVVDSLRRAGSEVSVITLPDGEAHKSLSSLEVIYDRLIRERFDRSSGLVALGGGVIGDITGFAAATFLRGVAFAQVPTTLLSQVDSSVGGKTGVNHPLGKNLIGAFYQPRHVHIDVATLDSLPAREFAAGMAEVVKYGIIRDRAFFDWLVAEAGTLRRVGHDALILAVKRSCQIKANVVEIDEKESSLRAILNFGHTFGHAVETLTGYGEVRHGEAVSIGMIVAAAIARQLGLCDDGEVAAIRDLLRAFDLPVAPPNFPSERYLEAMSRDKKVQDGVLRMVLNHGIGDCSIREFEDPGKIFPAVLAKLAS